MPPLRKDKLGRRLTTASQEALAKINAERRHEAGIVGRQHHIAMRAEDHALFADLTPLERGQLIAAALEEAARKPKR